MLTIYIQVNLLLLVYILNSKIIKTFNNLFLLLMYVNLVQKSFLLGCNLLAIHGIIIDL